MNLNSWIIIVSSGKIMIWIKESYHASSIIDVDVDKKDILLNPQDRAWLLAEIAKFKKD